MYENLLNFLQIKTKCNIEVIKVYQKNHHSDIFMKRKAHETHIACLMLLGEKYELVIERDLLVPECSQFWQTAQRVDVPRVSLTATHFRHII